MILDNDTLWSTIYGTLYGIHHLYSPIGYLRTDFSGIDQASLFHLMSILIIIHPHFIHANLYLFDL